MSRKVSFAWVTKIYDFDTLESAIDYIYNHLGKGWMFTEVKPNADGSGLSGEYAEKFYDYGYKDFILYTDDVNTFGKKNVNGYYSVEVRIPYQNYTCGW